MMHHTQHHWVNAKHIWNNQGYFYTKHITIKGGTAVSPLPHPGYVSGTRGPTIKKEFPQKKLMENVRFKQFIESLLRKQLRNFFWRKLGLILDSRWATPFPSWTNCNFGKGTLCQKLLFGANFLTWQIWQIAKSFNGRFVGGIKKVFRPHLVVCWLVTPDKMWLSRIRPKLSN